MEDKLVTFSKRERLQSGKSGRLSADSIDAVLQPGCIPAQSGNAVRISLNRLISGIQLRSVDRFGRSRGELARLDITDREVSGIDTVRGEARTARNFNTGGVEREVTELRIRSGNGARVSRHGDLITHGDVALDLGSGCRKAIRRQSVGSVLSDRNAIRLVRRGVRTVRDRETIRRNLKQKTIHKSEH